MNQDNQGTRGPLSIEDEVMRLYKAHLGAMGCDSVSSTRNIIIIDCFVRHFLPTIRMEITRRIRPDDGMC